MISNIVEQPHNREQGLSLLNDTLEQTEPYIRLQLQGMYRPANDLKKSDFIEFAKLQHSAFKLMNDEEKSIQLLTKQLSEHVNQAEKQSHVSSLLYKYNKFLKQPDKYQFSIVLKKALACIKSDHDESWLTLEFISALWQVDEKELAEALDSINPKIRNGKKKVRLTDFSFYAERVLSELTKF